MKDTWPIYLIILTIPIFYFSIKNESIFNSFYFFSPQTCNYQVPNDVKFVTKKFGANPQKQNINLIWLHGLGGYGPKTFSKIVEKALDRLEEAGDSSSCSFTINCFLPTSLPKFNRWKRVGTTNSWFHLNEIKHKKAPLTVDSEAPLQIEKSLFRSTKTLQKFISCIDKKYPNQATILGGGSQGGALLWTFSELLRIGELELEPKNINFILANTWLPNQIQNSSKIYLPNTFNLIYNQFDPIIPEHTVELSIENSLAKFYNNTLVFKIENAESGHEIGGEEYIEFVRERIMSVVLNK